jgi:hypothetical protein
MANQQQDNKPYNPQAQEIIILIREQLSNYPNLKAIVEEHRMRPSSLFLPQSLKAISDLISYNESVIFEAMDLLDVVATYSLLYYSDEEFFTKSIKNVIMNSRLAQDMSLTVGAAQIDDFIYNDKIGFSAFLNSNPTLVGLYIYTLVKFIFSE